MNISLRLASFLIFTVFLAGCSSFAGQRDRDIAYQQPRMQHSQPLVRGSITGEVTAAGGLITEDGIPYRLNGANAAPLRDFTGQTVTVEGFLTRFEGDRAIIVQDFQTIEPSRAARSRQERMNARGAQDRQRQRMSRDADVEGMTNARPDRQDQSQWNRDLPVERQQRQMSRDTDAPGMNNNMRQDLEITP